MRFINNWCWSHYFSHFIAKRKRFIIVLLVCVKCFQSRNLFIEVLTTWNVCFPYSAVAIWGVILSWCEGNVVVVGSDGSFIYFVDLLGACGRHSVPLQLYKSWDMAVPVDPWEILDGTLCACGPPAHRCTVDLLFGPWLAGSQRILIPFLIRSVEGIINGINNQQLIWFIKNRHASVFLTFFRIKEINRIKPLK